MSRRVSESIGILQSGTKNEPRAAGAFAQGTSRNLLEFAFPEEAPALSSSIQLGAALAMVALCALVHAAGLSGISRLFHLEDAELKARKTAGTLGLVVVIALALFVLHLAEIGLFAALYAGVAAAPDFADALYYSASAYTTAGNGIEDLGKGWRLLGATEALAGFLLIGWSVAYLVARLRRLRE
jgi:hypothetical protein